MAGMSYFLSEANMIPNQKFQVQNAVLMSNAVYQADPFKYLNESSANHTIHTVHAVSKHSDQGVMLAVGKVNDKDTLYVAYRGTATWNDGITDVDIEMQNNASIPRREVPFWIP